MNEKVINEKLDNIAKLINNQNILQKDILTFNEAVAYTGLSTSLFYKATSARSISFSKPNGRKLFFKRSDIDTWLMKNRTKTKEEIKAEALQYVIISKKGGKK